MGSNSIYKGKTMSIFKRKHTNSSNSTSKVKVLSDNVIESEANLRAVTGSRGSGIYPKPPHGG